MKETEHRRVMQGHRTGDRDIKTPYALKPKPLKPKARPPGAKFGSCCVASGKRSNACLGSQSRLKVGGPALALSP